MLSILKIKSLLCLILLALCCFSSACSKKSESDSKLTDKSKVVDLGENNDDEDENAKKSHRSKLKDRADHDNNSDDDDFEKGRKSKRNREMAKKNDEASKNPDGSSKRGKPAAQIEEEEAQNAKKNNDTPNSDTPNKPEPTKEPLPEPTQEKADLPQNDEMPSAADPDQNSDEGFDFSDETSENAQTAPAPKPPREPKLKPLLDFEKFITIRELREQTNFSGSLTEARLLGQNPGVRYKIVRLQTDNPNELGFAIQIWRLGNETAAQKRFNDLFDQSFGGKKLRDIATDAFLSKHHKLIELAFYDKNRRAAVLLSCSESICSPQQLQNIAPIVLRRL